MATSPSPIESKQVRPTSFIVGALVVLCAVAGITCFFLAREMNWNLGWLYVGLFGASLLVHVVCVLLLNPIVLARRAFLRAGTKIWDIAWLVTFIPMVVAIYFVARHDLNTRSAPPGPHGISWLIGASIFVFGWAIVTWAMIANPFFEKTVRIQTEHGHRVIDHGPYACIRHPGYVGFGAIFLATPLLLDSAWTLLPTLLCVIWLVIRTVFEDRMLKAELAGYADYAQRVRYRLIPGIW